MKESISCRSIFKSGASETTSQDITRIWIALINQLEQSKAVLVGA